jgi:hypothetical protein
MQQQQQNQSMTALPLMIVITGSLACEVPHLCDICLRMIFLDAWSR